MSRWTFQRKAGLIFALVAFVLGVTAAAALGWENEEKEKGKEKEVPPTVTAPAQPSQPAVPAPAAPAPAAPAPVAPAPAPVAPQGAPAQAPPEQVEEKAAPEQKVAAEEEQNVPAAAPAAQPTLAPVVERKQLARTGLDPVLMALLGVLCLAGGGLLFRRALTR